MWKASLVNGRHFDLICRASGAWLAMNATLTEEVPPSKYSKLLTIQHGFKWNSRFVLAADCRSIGVRSDLSIDSRGLISTTRMEEAIEGIQEASHSILEGESAGLEKASSEKVYADGQDGISEVCDETMWSHRNRPAEKIVFDLEVMEGSFQAVVEKQKGGYLISVELLDTDVLTELSRTALAILLLRASHELRFVRPSLSIFEERIVVRYGIRFSVIPDVSEMNQALAALSVACSSCGRELCAIQDESVADAYLSAVGFHIH